MDRVSWRSNFVFSELAGVILCTRCPGTCSIVPCIAERGYMASCGNLMW